MQVQEKQSLQSLRHKLRELKFGNIDFLYFIEKLDLKIENISSFDISSFDATLDSKDFFELQLNLETNFFLNENDAIKEQLQKLSKHSIKYDIRLKEVNDVSENRYLTFVFGKRILQKYPLINSIRTAPVSVETIRDIVGLRRNADYCAISDRPCNNGWQYIFHTNDIDLLNLSYIDQLLDNSRLSKQFYIKVFGDNFGYLRIILQNKSAKRFHKNGIPQVNAQHIAAILRINDDCMKDTFDRKDEHGYTVLKLSDSLVANDDLSLNQMKLTFITDEIFNHFSDYYSIEVDSTNRTVFRFKLKTENYNQSKDYIIETILNNVKNNTMSVHQAAQVLKSL